MAGKIVVSEILSDATSSNTVKIGSGMTLDLNSQGAVTMPTGSLVQMVNVNPSSSSQLTSAGGFHELTTSLRLSITPKSASNVLYLSFSSPFVSPNTTHLHYGRFYDVTNSAIVNAPPTVGSRDPVHWTMRVDPYDANDNHMMTMATVVSASNTNARTYTIHHRTEGATAQFYVSSLSSAAGYTSKLLFTIMEIAG
jgi:hypothetical protein